MPTFHELCQSSASKGGMEKTVEFKYDEHVSVVMAAFRERTQSPHPSMPLVHKVDILEERAESTAKVALRGTTDHAEDENAVADTDGWAMRLRRFFAANDAPAWVRKVSGGEYLRGTEQIEWSEAEGVMNMYTVNESHSHLITAEEICVIRADPDRPTTGTIKTLTVRARLRIRGWWTLGLSHVAEKFLLGRYVALVEQGKRIELDEIARWRETGRADKLLAAAAARAEKLLMAALSGRRTAAATATEKTQNQGTSSPVSTLTFRNRGVGSGDEDGGDSGASSPDNRGLEKADDADAESGAADVESQLNTTGSTEVLLEAGLTEDQWLMMRYKYDQQQAVGWTGSGDPRGKQVCQVSDSPPTKTEEEPESPLHIPLQLNDDKDEEAEAEQGNESENDSFLSYDDFKSFYSASEAGVSEYAFSAKDRFSRSTSPVSFISGDDNGVLSVNSSPAALSSISGVVSPSPIRPVKNQESESEPELGVKDFDLESTRDESTSTIEVEEVDLDKLEAQAEVLMVKEKERRRAAAAAEVEAGVPASSDSSADADENKKNLRAGGVNKKGGWRKVLVRVAVLGTTVAIAHEKRDQLRPVAVKTQARFKATVLQMTRRVRRLRNAVALASSSEEEEVVEVDKVASPSSSDADEVVVESSSSSPTVNATHHVHVQGAKDKTLTDNVVPASTKESKKTKTRKRKSSKEQRKFAA